MLHHEREKIILSRLQQSQSLRVSDLSQELGVSEATVRRDLDRLERLGRLNRVHGGAAPLQREVPEPPILQRVHQNAQEKKKIGALAASLIQDGETIFLGSGTTTIEVARNLFEHHNLTVITNSIPLMNLLSRYSNLSVIGIGGFLRSTEMSFVGHIAEQALRELRMDKVMIGIPAIEVEAGLTNDYLPEVMTDRTVIGMASELFVVADHSKFGKVASGYLAPVSQVSVLVTDHLTDAPTLEKIRQLGVKVYVAG